MDKAFKEWYEDSSLAKVFNEVLPPKVVKIFEGWLKKAFVAGSKYALVAVFKKEDK